MLRSKGRFSNIIDAISLSAAVVSSTLDKTLAGDRHFIAYASKVTKIKQNHSLSLVRWTAFGKLTL
jgi:hypothetical protein